MVLLVVCVLFSVFFFCVGNVVFLPSMKSSRVCARFCIKPRQFLVLDAANVVVVVVVGTVDVLAFAFVRHSLLIACDWISA